MKILTIDDMLEAAQRVSLPDYRQHVAAIESASTALAQSLAAHLHIEVKSPASWEGKELGGVAAAFGPAQHHQPCPPVINQLDPGGDWEF